MRRRGQGRHMRMAPIQECVDVGMAPIQECLDNGPRGKKDVDGGQSCHGNDLYREARAWTCMALLGRVFLPWEAYKARNLTVHLP